MSGYDMYYQRLAAAYVRGRLGSDSGSPSLVPLFARPLSALSVADLEAIIAAGLEAGLRLHRFKRTMELPRVSLSSTWMRPMPRCSPATALAPIPCLMP